MAAPGVSHRKLIIGLGLGCVAMFGFGFALVPLYDVLCEKLGINGKTRSEAASYSKVEVDEARTVEVEFIAQVQPGMPWEFGPVVKRMQVHPGQLVRTEFRATNHSAKRIVGQAIPSVSPGQGAAYFNKTECFCFNQQVLAGQDSASLPLIFFVDPDLPASIGTLTLSYTLYDITDKSLGGAIQAGAAK
ncbi:cytochrome c oxidase assembly protein [Shewanella sp. JM162201]|uniref:Cytochrome c oxidase assembly protein CtaG n=1 Tax=Shewanella jiangmenensis TaxID=2837387 RepID=A0ABS5V442_9GAMM|nr:cytochrome c oxidase assembly protein [Shewanella jiangmenensis]MBT1445200.1 cytochrome c oxidase assembly protein [Shewanella jiangmenensis]